jgi:hypothetical protein
MMAQASMHAWKSYARWRRVFWTSLLVLLAVGLSSAKLNRIVFAVPRGARIVFFPLIVVPGLLVIVSLARIRLFRCPRCENRFAIARYEVPHLFNRECVHCGLPKWANEP